MPAALSVLADSRRTPPAGSFACSPAVLIRRCAYKMMKRARNLSFVHFWEEVPRQESLPFTVARQLVERLVPWQFTAKLYLVPFEPLQREIAAQAPESFRTLLYRRLMLRVAERIALRSGGKGVIHWR